MLRSTRACAVLVGLLIVSLLAALTAPVSGLLPAAASAATEPPSISSDQADYSAGSTVTLTGAHWQSGEAVHVVVNDEVGQSWSHTSNPDATADGDGTITYTFQLPRWFVASYTVIATGATSGVATTTFTDAPAQVNAGGGAASEFVTAGGAL